MSNDEREPRWNAGAIGRIPEDDSLVYRDDAVSGPQFYARSPSEAEVAAAQLNRLQRCADALEELTEAVMAFGPTKGSGTADGAWLRVFKAYGAARAALDGKS